MDFKARYNQLNEQQRAAVDQLDGPVLVIAGPGTGKTELLSLRVANLLKQTDTAPGAILCLTFTNKAATNMRDRLQGLIGPTANGITVKTFHGFGAELIELYPDSFFNGARLRNVPDATQIQLIQDILAGLPLSHPLALRFNGQFTLVDGARKALKLVKDAGLTPDKLRAVIAANLAYLDTIEPGLADALEPRLNVKQLDELAGHIEALPPQQLEEAAFPILSYDTVIKDSFAQARAQAEELGKGTPLSKWKQRWIQNVGGQRGLHKERERNAWWLAVADLYEQYRERLHGQGYFDYSDMIVEAIARLEQDDNLRADAQERFQHVLIDEFQDTNEAQLRLAHLIASHPANEDRPNLMVVGDDDQSIFKFQGAELNNMLNFRRRYRDVKTIVLKENYRSTQAVLDAARSVIEQAENRLVTHEADLSKDIHAAAPPPAGEVAHLRYPTREHQLVDVAARIQQLRIGDPNCSVAVLARRHESLELLSPLLISRGLALRYERQANILDHDAVCQVMLLAELLVAISDGNRDAANHILHKLLRHPTWGLEPLELWRLAADNFYRPDWVAALAGSANEDLVRIHTWLQELSQLSEREPLRVVFEHLIGLESEENMLAGYRSPLRSYFLRDGKELSFSYVEALSALQLLRQATTEFSGSERPSLRDFVAFINVNRDNRLVLADETPFVSGENPVELMTVHKAKGLEFDVVFVVDAVEPDWKPSARGRKPPANLPLQPHGDDWDDYARLMYVAATRAKRSLYPTSYASDDRGREVLATPLVRHGFETLEQQPADAPPARDVLEESLRWPRLDTKDERALLKPQLERYSLSVTHLLRFLDLSRPEKGPRGFLEHVLLRLPEAKRPQTAYGSAVHDTLEWALKAKHGGNFTEAKLLKQFSHELESQQLRQRDRERYLQHGQDVLRRLFSLSSFDLPVDSQAERKIADVRVGSATINGKLDRIDQTATGAVIVDYKTGRGVSTLDNPPKDEGVKAWEHRTQLIFYALLAGQVPDLQKSGIADCRMVYVEAEDERDLVKSYCPTTEDTQRLGALIERVWDHVMRLDFPDTSDYETTLEGITRFEQDLLDGKI